MAFTAPTVVLTRNSGGSVTSTTGTFSAAVPASTPLTIGISVSSDTPTISSVGPDSKGNAYTLVGHQATTTGQPIWIYRSWVTTPLTTSDTLAVTISSGAVINVIAVAAPGTAWIPLQFTGGNLTPAAAAFQLSVPAPPSAANGSVIAFSVNASAAPTWLTPGPTALTTTSGGGGPFFSCAYEDVRDFPATLEIDMSPNSTASMAVTAVMSEYTDLYTDAYSSLYGQFTGTPWPASGPLEADVQLLLNGTWTSIFAYVYARGGGGITITRGRPDESSRLVTAQCQLQLNNRTGAFSPANTASPFYPYITRNTQLRVLVPASYNSTDAGLVTAFSGEVPSWPPSWDVSENDVWVPVTASGITRRLNQRATLGSALSRFYLQKDTADPLYPIAYWPCEDGSTSSQFAEVTGNQAIMTFTGTPTLASDGSFGGSDPLPVLNNSAWASTVGAFGDPGSATYIVPGTHTFTPRAGLSSVTAEAWGGGGGGSNGYQANTGKDAAGGGGEYAKDTIAVTGGSSYPVTVGAGGAGGPKATVTRVVLTPGLQQRFGADGGTSRFVGDAGAQVVAHGGKGGTFTGSRGGNGGSGSTNGTHRNGGNGGKNSGAFFGGSGGGSSAGTAAAGNAGGNGGGSNTGAAGGAAVTGGGKGGKGGNGGASVDQGGTAGSLPGGGGGSGGENSGNAAAHSGGNGGAGMVKLTWTPLSAPSYNVLRFLMHVPSGGDTNNAVVARYLTGGTVARVDLVYTTATSGTLTLNCYNSIGGLLSSSVGITGVNGVPEFISMELGPGAAISYTLRAMPANNPSNTVGTAGTATASGTIAAVTQVLVNPDGALSGTAIGHLLLQYDFETLGNLSGAGNAGLGPVSGWAQEKVGHRFGRLCAEENIPYSLIGDVEHGPSTGAQMGPQPDDKLIAVLQQLEDLDGGLLCEPPGLFGLEYRARASMVRQLPALIADYAAGQVSPPFQPTADDLLTRNIITVSRTSGSSVTVRDVTSPMSSLDPPNGVGQYPYAVTVNAAADSQLAVVAARILAQGTVSDFRYPQVTFQLARQQVKELMGTLTQLGDGDRIRVLNPPGFLGTGTIDLLAVGFTWTVQPLLFTVTLNCVPESPYES